MGRLKTNKALGALCASMFFYFPAFSKQVCMIQNKKPLLSPEALLFCRESWTMFEPITQGFRTNKGLSGTESDFIGHS
jgi:hypothetical protein